MEKFLSEAFTHAGLFLLSIVLTVLQQLPPSISFRILSISFKILFLILAQYPQDDVPRFV